jgi:hypothetical protein
MPGTGIAHDDAGRLALFAIIVLLFIGLLAHRRFSDSRTDSYIARVTIPRCASRSRSMSGIELIRIACESARVRAGYWRNPGFANLTRARIAAGNHAGDAAQQVQRRDAGRLDG